MSEQGKTEEQAAKWVAREDGGLSAEDMQILAGWLDSSDANRVAYLRLKSSWDQTARLAALKNSAQFAEFSPPQLRWPLVAVAAVLLILVIGGGMWRFYFVSPVQQVSYATRIGERPVLRLSDGTRIQLNTNTNVSTSITSTKRIVTLQSGEAYFEVTHDENRPFIVLAGNRRIVDLGTKFSVRRYGDDVRVIVTEGRVRVEEISKPTPSVPVYADSGSVVVAKADETLVAAKTADDISEDLSWRTGMLIFNQKTLADAAEEFNRYNRKPIIVQGAARDIRIGGSFRADNSEVFATLVRSALGLTVKNEPREIVISQ